VRLPEANVFEDAEVSVMLIVDVPALSVDEQVHTAPVPVIVQVLAPKVIVPAAWPEKEEEVTENPFELNVPIVAVITAELIRAS
jgi:hypothetical protein